MVIVDAAVHDGHDDVGIADTVVFPDGHDVDVTTLGSARFRSGIVEVPLPVEHRVVEGYGFFGHGGGLCGGVYLVEDTVVVGADGDGPVLHFQDAGDVFERTGSLGQRRRIVEPDVVPAVQAGLVRPFLELAGIGEGAFHANLPQHGGGLCRNQRFGRTGALHPLGGAGIDPDADVSFLEQGGGIISGRCFQDFFLVQRVGRTGGQQ